MSTSTHGSQPPSLSPAQNALTALMGSIVAVASGVDPSCTVAMQCICGRTFEQYLFLNATVELKHRYSGMKAAFPTGREIYVPVREEESDTVPRPLSELDYDSIVVAADHKFNTYTRQKSNVRVNASLVEQNPFPVWKWMSRKCGWPMTFVFACLALLPVPVVVIARCAAGESWIPMLVRVLSFMLVKMYDGALLDIRRDVCYIRVGEKCVSDTMRGVWARLLDCAQEGPPKSASDAIRELAQGHVRKRDMELLIPVLALRPSVEFEVALWLQMFTHLRTPLLTVSDFLFTNADSWGIIALGVAAFAQVSLQNLFTDMVYLHAVPYEVLWFRRLPGHVYEKEYEPYRRDLG